MICEGLKYIQKNFVEAECNIMLGVPLIFENIYRKIWTNAEKSGSTDKLRRAIGMSMKLDLRNNRAVTKRLFKALHGIFGESLHLLIAGGAAIDCYGEKVHEKVLEYGVKITRATTHFVDENTDTGPIIMQRCVEVKYDDTVESLS